MSCRERSHVCDISQCLDIFILVRTALSCTDEMEGNASQGDKTCGVLKEMCMSLCRKASDSRNTKTVPYLPHIASEQATMIGHLLSSWCQTDPAYSHT